MNQMLTEPDFKEFTMGIDCIGESFGNEIILIKKSELNLCF
jgi:hypothetical protein